MGFKVDTMTRVMQWRRNLDDVLDRAVGEGRVGGAVVVVALRGEIVFERACGLADIEVGVPITRDSVFRLSSLTKPIVVAGLLALVRERRLSLDTVVQEYLPEFQPKTRDGRCPNVTVRHLLTHTSGLTTELPRGVSIRSTGDLLRGYTSLSFSPGAAWQYSRGHDVLGALLAVVTGVPLAEALDELVLLPLATRDTSFSVADPGRLAACYICDGGALARMSNPHRASNPWGGESVFHPNRALDPDNYPLGSDGMVGTAGDFLSVLECFRVGGPPLNSDLSASAISDQIPHLGQSTSAGWKFSLIGATLEDPGLAGVRAPRGLVRWGGDYGHAWWIDPTNSISVVSMTNTAFEGSDGAFPQSILAGLYI